MTIEQPSTGDWREVYFKICEPWNASFLLPATEYIRSMIPAAVQAIVELQPDYLPPVFYEFGSGHVPMASEQLKGYLAGFQEATELPKISVYLNDPIYDVYPKIKLFALSHIARVMSESQILSDWGYDNLQTELQTQVAEIDSSFYFLRTEYELLQFKKLSQLMQQCPHLHVEFLTTGLTAHTELPEVEALNLSLISLANYVPNAQVTTLLNQEKVRSCVFVNNSSLGGTQLFKNTQEKDSPTMNGLLTLAEADFLSALAVYQPTLFEDFSPAYGVFALKEDDTEVAKTMQQRQAIEILSLA